MSLVTSFAIAVASSVVGDFVTRIVSKFGKKMLADFDSNKGDICAPRKQRCGTEPAPYLRGGTPALA